MSSRFPDFLQCTLDIDRVCSFAEITLTILCFISVLFSFFFFVFLRTKVVRVRFIKRCDDVDDDERRERLILKIGAWRVE